MTKFLNLFNRQTLQIGPEAEEIKALSDQFRVTLKAAVDKIEARGESGEAIERTKKLLAKEDWRWKDAYQVEQQVVLHYDPDTLRTELSRRILEAKDVLYPDVAAWYHKKANETNNLEEQRALLLRLVNDLQWRYTVNEAKLGYVKQITGRTGWIFILAVVFFIAFLSYVQWGTPQNVQFMVFLLAAVSGFLGASFSMLVSLKTRLESSGINQMKNASSRAILFSRVLVGTGAAMILYFFFESKLLGGTAFPKIDESPDVVVRALLVVWCFIAGFSEKLVPELLAKTEAQAIDQSQTAPHGPITLDVPSTTDATPKPPAAKPLPAASEADASKDKVRPDFMDG